MLNYDAERFAEDLKDHRGKMLFRLLLRKSKAGQYVNAQALCDEVTRDRRRFHRDRGKIRNQGTPSRTMKQLKYLIRIGCFEAHPDLGVRLSSSFIPQNQASGSYRCGKCDQENLGRHRDEILPEHARRCPKRTIKVMEATLDMSEFSGIAGSKGEEVS